MIRKQIALVIFVFLYGFLYFSLFVPNHVAPAHQHLISMLSSPENSKLTPDLGNLLVPPQHRVKQEKVNSFSSVSAYPTQAQ